MAKPYHLTSPFGEVPTYKWRIQDIMNAMIKSGLSIAHVEEMYAEDGSFWLEGSVEEEKTLTQQELDDLCDWRINALSALPQWLTIHVIYDKE